ncbi:MAG TPA: multicopper oxidase domain-containing protein [Gemmatimonadales bacterium]|jgi:FtsP/CotA-like multicopper oxidase with cupredoxin domain|nr:multicopper oxidase domain-containing protein [Gemmatimonadales bacterium]
MTALTRRAALRIGPTLSLLFAAGCAATSANGGRTHAYYVAADEVMWDYAPAAGNGISGESWSPLDKEFVEQRPDRVGKVYKKAVYHEYTDSTFTTLKPRPAGWEHLGILGPLLRASVGDTFRIVFRNNGTHPYSMHPHGVIYDKDSEGAPYADGTTGKDKADDGVPPGGTHVYLWPVPERAGPASGDGSSVMWMYHSHVNEMLDVNAGLIGGMIITARGKARADGSPVDVDREIMVLFGEFDENFSWFKDENFKLAKLDMKKVPSNPTFADPFYLANLRETMNGLSFGNLPALKAKKGEHVRWYVFSLTGFEMHAPHWHGETVIENHMRTDVAPLITMEMKIADMVPDNPGTWLFHCHVAPHLIAGMQALFTVE